MVATVAVIGLGSVGLPVAAALAASGLAVLGLDRAAERVATIAAGKLPFVGEEPDLEALLSAAHPHLRVTTNPAELSEVTTVFVAVETPVLAGTALWEPLDAALADIVQYARNATLVIVESTVAPGTMRGRVVPALPDHVAVAHCPERVMPGKLVANLRTMPRVCGVDRPETAPRLREIYARFVTVDLRIVDLATAELVKTAENAYRDLQIAFANAIAIACEAHGANFPEVRALVNQVPGRAMLEAGAGVGGACIPKDTQLLANSLLHSVSTSEPKTVAEAEAISARNHPAFALFSAARTVNDRMPAHVVELASEALAAAGISVEHATISVLGTSYLPEQGDERGSPGLAIAALFKEKGATVRCHDPFVPARAGDLAGVLDGSDALVLVTAHHAYRALPLVTFAGLMRTRILIDGRFVYSKADAENAGFTFRGVGRG